MDYVCVLGNTPCLRIHSKFLSPVPNDILGIVIIGYAYNIIMEEKGSFLEGVTDFLKSHTLRILEI